MPRVNVAVISDILTVAVNNVNTYEGTAFQCAVNDVLIASFTYLREYKSMRMKARFCVFKVVSHNIVRFIDQMVE